MSSKDSVMGIAIFSISSHLLLWEAASQTKYCCPSKIQRFELATSLQKLRYNYPLLYRSRQQRPRSSAHQLFSWTCIFALHAGTSMNAKKLWSKRSVFIHCMPHGGASLRTFTVQKVPFLPATFSMKNTVCFKCRPTDALEHSVWMMKTRLSRAISGKDVR